MSFRVTMLFCLLVAVMTGFGEAQVSPERPTSEMLSDSQPVGSEPTYLRAETPAQRAARLGTTEDPGPNPEPAMEFSRFGRTYTISRFDRRWAVYNDPTCGDAGWIRPFGGVNVCRELYQHNDKYVWVWMQKVEPVSDDPTQQAQEESPTHRFTEREIDYLSNYRSEFSEVIPATANGTLRFEESSQGLPASGSFRNSLAVADMNGDGHVDVIIPPERGTGQKTPQIFLGDGTGKWNRWAIRWPRTLDYGNVVAADLNGDRRPDLVFGVHLRGVYVFINEGGGVFTDSETGLPRNYPTRRVVVADVDVDGAPDIVAISEGPTINRDPQTLGYGKMLAFLNRDKARSWQPMDIVDNRFNVGSDWMSVGHFNDDKVPDFAAGSIYFGGADTLWTSVKKNEWKSLASTDGKIVPGLSYFNGNATGRFRTKSKYDDAVVSFVRFWPSKLDAKVVPPPANLHAAGIDYVTFDKSGAKRTPIMRWGSRAGIWGVAAGDFDGDKDLDVAFSRYDPREAVVLVGDGKGGFKRVAVEGLTLKSNTNYDLQVADVNGDGRDDLLLMYETSSSNNAFAPRDGSVHVYLSRGIVANSDGAAK